MGKGHELTNVAKQLKDSGTDLSGLSKGARRRLAAALREGISTERIAHAAVSAKAERRGRGTAKSAAVREVTRAAAGPGVNRQGIR